MKISTKIKEIRRICISPVLQHFMQTLKYINTRFIARHKTAKMY